MRLTRAAAWAAALLLSACAVEDPVAGPIGAIPLRNPTAPLASQADVSAADLSGDWAVRGLAGAGFGRADRVRLGAEGAALLVEASVIRCSDASGLCESEMRMIPYAAAGPGRWSLGAPVPGALELPETLWVLWSDTGRRTAALGDPDGTALLLLDREASGGGDRIAAAREILDWYGYDLRRLEAAE